MKRALLSLSTLAILASTTFAGVKYEYNDVDKFTNNHSFKTEALEVAGKIAPAKKVSYKKVSIAVQYQDSTNLVILSLKSGKAPQLSVGKGSNLKLRLADGSSVTLPIISKGTDGGKIYYWKFGANVDNTAFLKGQKVTDLRVDGTAGDFDVTIPAKLQSDLHEQMKAMSDAPCPIQLQDIQLNEDLIKKYNRM